MYNLEELDKLLEMYNLPRLNQELDKLLEMYNLPRLNQEEIEIGTHRLP